MQACTRVRGSLSLSLLQTETLSAKWHPHKNRPWEWVDEALSRKVGNEDLTVSAVKEQWTQHSLGKDLFRRKTEARALFRRFRFEDICWAHSGSYWLRDIETKLLSKHITPLTCIFLASERKGGKKSKGRFEAVNTCISKLHNKQVSHLPKALLTNITKKIQCCNVFERVSLCQGYLMLISIRHRTVVRWKLLHLLTHCVAQEPGICLHDLEQASTASCSEGLHAPTATRQLP